MSLFFHSAESDASILYQRLQGISMLLIDKQIAYTLIRLLGGFLEAAHHELISVGDFVCQLVHLLNFCRC